MPKAVTPAVSVIIPCFNSELYLEECLNSVINQTFKDIEILVINSRSTDNTVNIINKYAKKDKRIILFDFEDKGLCYQLNYGIKQAKGEYIAFLDSDDYYNINFLERTYNTAKEFDLDLVSVDYCEFSGSIEKHNLTQTLKPCTQKPSTYNKIISGKDKEAYTAFNHRWRTLHRRKFLSETNILHDENLINWEDCSFHFECVLAAKSIMHLNFTGVYHRKDNNNSITKNEDNMVSQFNAAHKSAFELLQKNPDFPAKKELFFERYIYNLNFTIRLSNKDCHLLLILECSKQIKEFTKNMTISIDKTVFNNKNTYNALINLAFSPVEYYESYLAQVCKISVIMAVYNSEKYLKETLDSLCAQTLKETEFILIDDGSTDSSPEIMQEYADKDSRFKLLKQENKGAGAARNLGMEYAQGAYLSFLDSDDYFYPNMLQEISEATAKNTPDVLIFKSEQFETARNLCRELTWFFANNGVNFPNKPTFTLNEMTSNPYLALNGCAWDKAFNRKFVQKNLLHFKELFVSNDAYFTYSALTSANKISVLPKVLLRWILRSNLSSEANISRKNHNIYPLAIFESISGIFDNIKNTKPSLATNFSVATIKMFYWYFVESIDFDEVAAMAFDKFSSGFLDYIGITQLNESIIPSALVYKYRFFLRLSEYEPGQFAEFKQSLTDNPIEDKGKSFVIEPGEKTTSKFIFIQKDAKHDAGVPFFKLELTNEPYKNVITEIKFIYLANNTPFYSDILRFYAFLDKDLNMKVVQAEWEKGEDIFRTKISYKIENNIILFYANYTGYASGFEFKTMLLTSRIGVGHSVKLKQITQGDLRNQLKPIPKDVVRITNTLGVVQNNIISTDTELYKTVFKNAASADSVIPLFKISLKEEIFNNCSAMINFIILNNRRPNVYNTLYLEIGVESTGVSLYSHKWQEQNELSDSVYYTIDKDAITVYGQYQKQGSGWAFKEGFLTSRNQISPDDLPYKFISLITEQLVFETIALPKNAKSLKAEKNDIEILELENQELKNQLKELEKRLLKLEQNIKGAKK
ncbi:MAG: glycosyltransferase [Oscillospiraceae bacterium]|jgi:glycosyltransferase involved in cell wall biosynthesis|nr:glycosyltransferase [Oscillospiraceae bacterium]